MSDILYKRVKYPVTDYWAGYDYIEAFVDTVFVVLGRPKYTLKFVNTKSTHHGQWVRHCPIETFGDSLEIVQDYNAITKYAKSYAETPLDIFTIGDYVYSEDFDEYGIIQSTSDYDGDVDDEGRGFFIDASFSILFDDGIEERCNIDEVYRTKAESVEGYNLHSAYKSPNDPNYRATGFS